MSVTLAMRFWSSGREILYMYSCMISIHHQIISILQLTIILVYDFFVNFTVPDSNFFNFKQTYMQNATCKLRNYLNQDFIANQFTRKLSMVIDTFGYTINYYNNVINICYFSLYYRMEQKFSVLQLRVWIKLSALPFSDEKRYSGDFNSSRCRVPDMF